MTSCATCSTAPSRGAIHRPEAAGNPCKGIVRYGFDAGMHLRADVAYGLDAFRGHGTVTPYVSARSGAGNRVGGFVAASTHVLG